MPYYFEFILYGVCGGCAAIRAAPEKGDKLLFVLVLPPDAADVHAGVLRLWLRAVSCISEHNIDI